MPRTIRLSTRLDADYDTVVTLLMQSATLHHIAAPLIRFKPDGPPFPRVWTEGSWRMRMTGPLGLPLGWQEIRITFPDAPDGMLRIRDDGRGAMARRWDHLIEIAPDGDGTRYTDTVTVEAGWRTPVTALFARIFYAHRQRRWRQLVTG